MRTILLFLLASAVASNASAATVSYDFQTTSGSDFNWIGLPVAPSGFSDAASFKAAIDADFGSPLVRSMAKWNAISQSFTQYVQVPFETGNFPLVLGDAVRVEVLANHTYSFTDTDPAVGSVSYPLLTSQTTNFNWIGLPSFSTNLIDLETLAADITADTGAQPLTLTVFNPVSQALTEYIPAVGTGGETALDLGDAVRIETSASVTYVPGVGPTPVPTPTPEPFSIPTFDSEFILDTANFGAYCLTVAQGDILVMDAVDGNVYDYGADGSSVTTFNAFNTPTEFAIPTGLHYNPVNDAIYAVNPLGNLTFGQIKVFTRQGAYSGDFTQGTFPSITPTLGVDIESLPNGQLVVAEANSALNIYSTGTVLIETIATVGLGPEEIPSSIRDIAVSPDGTAVYVNTDGAPSILCYKLVNGDWEYQWTVTESAFGIDVDDNGNLHVARSSDVIAVLDPDGNFIDTYGTAGAGAGQINLVKDIEIEGNGIFILASDGNPGGGKVLKYTY